MYCQECIARACVPGLTEPLPLQLTLALKLRPGLELGKPGLVALLDQLAAACAAGVRGGKCRV